MVIFKRKGIRNVTKRSIGFNLTLDFLIFPLHFYQKFGASNLQKNQIKDQENKFFKYLNILCVVLPNMKTSKIWGFAILSLYLQKIAKYFFQFQSFFNVCMLCLHLKCLLFDKGFQDILNSTKLMMQKNINSRVNFLLISSWDYFTYKTRNC